MRLVTYEQGSVRRVGAVQGDTVLDLSDHFVDMRFAVRAGPDAAGEAVRHVATNVPPVPLKQVRLLQPLTPKRNIWAVGLNYLAHVEEGALKRGEDPQTVPEHAAFFSKTAACVIGPTDPIAYDEQLSTRMDYEAELAVIIGVGGRSIPRERALDHVFGYTVANDVTARDIQRRHGGQWLRGKSVDRTCPVGPWIVTAGEFGDPQSSVVRCYVNDRLMQEQPTGDMILPVADIIAELSLGITLFAGDIILTGTPSGVGYARDPAIWLRPGDVVRSQVDGIGEMSNRVEAYRLSDYVTTTD